MKNHEISTCIRVLKFFNLGDDIIPKLEKIKHDDLQIKRMLKKTHINKYNFGGDYEEGFNLGPDGFQSGRKENFNHGN